jgi:hypothetical protein
VPEPGQAPPVLHLDDEARAASRAFGLALEPRLGLYGDLRPIAEWGSKLHGAVLRLAGLLHLAARAGEPEPWAAPVGAATLEAAVRLAEESLIPHALLALGAVGEDRLVAGASVRGRGPAVVPTSRRTARRAALGRGAGAVHRRPALFALVCPGELDRSGPDPETHGLSDPGEQRSRRTDEMVKAVHRIEVPTAPSGRADGRRLVTDGAVAGKHQALADVQFAVLQVDYGGDNGSGRRLGEGRSFVAAFVLVHGSVNGGWCWSRADRTGEDGTWTTRGSIIWRG